MIVYWCRKTDGIYVHAVRYGGKKYYWNPLSAKIPWAPEFVSKHGSILPKKIADKAFDLAVEHNAEITDKSAGLSAEKEQEVHDIEAVFATSPEMAKKVAAAMSKSFAKAVDKAFVKAIASTLSSS